jgi:hypothetical protein
MRCLSDKRSLHSEERPGRKSGEIYFVYSAREGWYMKLSFFVMPLHQPSENPALAFDVIAR